MKGGGKQYVATLKELGDHLGMSSIFLGNTML
jgi:hypothetical protein